ncbi:hypothetical protein [Desertimonas flava]|uniref:hypothetical protein n=1 Tax=Desertimonas flava TaxID=2064846 RepID=UPI000E353FF9|nr:hypothetical protein [Desertimonas flava]
MSRYRELATELDGIGSTLDELSFDLLQEAMAAGATKRPDADKVLTQARRAVEKAARLLESLD